MKVFNFPEDFEDSLLTTAVLIESASTIGVFSTSLACNRLLEANVKKDKIINRFAFIVLKNYNFHLQN
jgi:hypothetical protein